MKKEHIMVALIAAITVVVVNTIVKRVPVAGPLVGSIWGGI